MNEDDLVQVWSTPDAVQAELVAARLESEGIEVLTKSGLGGSDAIPTGPAYLFVSAGNEADARRVIDAIEAGEYALDDDADVGEGAGAEGGGP
jgi:Putative prokaryotic signal transducing protein